MPGHKLLTLTAGVPTEVLGTSDNLDSTANRIPDTAWHGLGAPLNLTSTVMVTGQPQNIASAGVVVGYATASSLSVSGGSGSTGVLTVYGQYNGSSYPNTVKREFIDDLYVWTQRALNSTTWGSWSRALRDGDRNSNKLLASTTPVLTAGTNGLCSPLNLGDLVTVSGGAMASHYASQLRDAGFIAGYIDGSTLGVPGLSSGAIGSLTYYGIPSSGNMTAEFRYEGRKWLRVATGSTTWSDWKEFNLGVPVKKNGTLVGTRKNINLIEGTNISLTVADDSSNDEIDVTINATGGGSSYVPTDFYKNPYYQEDFLSTSVNAPWVASGVSGGTNNAAPSIFSIVADRPGVVLLKCGTTANSGYRYVCNNYAVLIGGGEESTCILSCDGISTGMNRFGFQDSTTSSNPSDAICFNIACTGVVTASCWSNGSETSVSFANITPANFYRFKIKVDSTSQVTFSIYDMAGTLVESQVITSGIPTASGRVTGHGIVSWSTGTTADNLCFLDFMDLYLPNRVRG